MPLAVEAVAGGSKVGGVGTTVTVSFTVTSANLLLVGIGVGFSNADPLTAVIGITYNGVTMTAVSGSDSDDNNFEGCRWYSLPNPDTGTHDVVATVNSAAQVGVGVVSFASASSTLGTPSIATNTTANPAVTVADSAAGEIVVSCVATDAAGDPTTEGGTVIADIENIDGDSDFNFQYQAATGPNTNATWTNPESGSGWAASGLSVRAASGGGGLQLMGQASF